MTMETMQELRANILMGKGARAWHYSANDANSVANHIDGPLTRELIEARLFNFNWIERPVYIMGDDGRFIQLESGRKAIVADDKLAEGIAEDAGVFMPGYTGHPFKGLLDATEALLGNDLGWDTAGLLKKRAVGFVQIALPDNFDTPEGLKYRPFLGFATSFDGSLSSTGKRGFTVWQCDNTLSAGLGEAGGSYKVKHSKYSAFKLDSAIAALDLIAETVEKVNETVAELASWQVTDLQFEQFLAKLVPVPELDPDKSSRGRTLAISKSERIRDIYRTDERACEWHGTALGVLQATNTYNQHEAPQRGNVDRDVRRFENYYSNKTGAADNATLDILAQVCEREYA